MASICRSRLHYAGVPDIELTDIAIQAVLHRVAAKHGIRTILSGGVLANESVCLLAGCATHVTAFMPKRL